jgi:hypothetical protein
MHSFHQDLARNSIRNSRILDDEDTGRKTLQALRDDFHRKHSGTTEPLDLAGPLEPSPKKRKEGSRILRRLQPQDRPRSSDIDR